MPDYYMQIKIEGAEIKGESADKEHKEWIEINSLSSGITQPASSAASQGGSKPTGRGIHSDIVISKMYDASSPHLSLACAKGSRVDEVVFELCRATGDKIPYLKIIIKNGFIAGWSIGGGGDVPSETVAIAFSEIEWEYKQLNPDDFKIKTTIGRKWNLATNGE